MTNEQFLVQLQCLSKEIMLNVEGLTEYQRCILSLIIENKIKKLDVCWYRKTNEENISYIKDKLSKIRQPKWNANKIPLKEPETFDFYEAIKRVVEGKKVMAHDWPDGDYIALNSLGHAEFFSNEVYSRALIYKDYLKKSWKEVKEQPKTFGWDEAYRLMKEGVKVTRKFYQGKLNSTLYWYIKNGSVVYNNASNCEYYGIVDKKELDATDWYVYEE